MKFLLAALPLIALSAPAITNAQSTETAICQFAITEALTEQRISRATVVHVSTVTIAASTENKALGAVIGGSLGGIVSHKQDSGTRFAVAALGAAAGTKAASELGKSRALQFIVEDTSTKAITAIVAEADSCATSIGKGAQVFIARSNGYPAKTRLIKE